MEYHDTTIKSWNRFLTRNLVVVPEILDTEHRFTFEGSPVTIKIPRMDQVDRGKGFDEVASVGARRASDESPIEFDIHKVDVEVYKSAVISVPVEVFDRNPNAYDLFSDEEQKRLNGIARQHQTIAEKAFDYWIRILRWVSDDSRIGRDRVEGIHSGWSTYLKDIESSQKLWIQSSVFHVPGYKTITLVDWREIQQKLETNSQPPVYIELKHDAEENVRLGEYQRAILDMAMACETFLRFTVLQNLPADLNPKIVKYIELASISQYSDHFFPEIIAESARERYRDLKPHLKTLFERRNTIVHSGIDADIDEKCCLEHIQVTQKLLSIPPICSQLP